jgi:hypothetical protein
LEEGPLCSNTISGKDNPFEKEVSFGLIIRKYKCNQKKENSCTSSPNVYRDSVKSRMKDDNVML